MDVKENSMAYKISRERGRIDAMITKIRILETQIHGANGDKVVYFEFKA